MSETIKIGKNEYDIDKPWTATTQDLQLALNELAALRKEVTQSRTWVADLQSGMYINCVYCGHRYGPKEDTPLSMADVLKEHIEHCEKHPMYALRKENAELKKFVDSIGILHREREE